jgi:uncharacterized membrane protein YozB (DUF420 family)
MVSQGKYRDVGILYVMLFVLAAFITVILSKRSVTGFNASINKYWILMLTGNIALTFFCLFCSISTLTKSLKLEKDKHPTITQTSVNKR